ncbi:MAG: GGDEF domain-containing protein [Desulfobacterales bacterium]
MYLIRRTVYPLFVPMALILFSSVAIIKWPDLLKQMHDVKELRAVTIIMPFVPYIVFAIGFAMGWRYANAGMILGSLALALSYYGIDHFGSVELPRTVIPNQSVASALAFLLPLNLAFYSGLTQRRLITSAGIFALILLMVQVSAVLFFCHPFSRISSRVMDAITSLSPLVADKLSWFSAWQGSVLSDHFFFRFEGIPTAAALAFGLAFLFVLVRFVKTGDIRICGFFFGIVAAMLGIKTGSSGPAVIFYFFAAGLILVITTVEASFFMAYIDELTALPGRRSLNETLLNLGKKYTIAMIDVDHFKKFNDTFGHKTGDQVLKIIASRLGKISGGAKTFRYGGEEFTAIFAGKTVEDAIPYIEDFREAIGSTPFTVRDWKHRSKKKNDRRHKNCANRKQVKVTVSIGLASPGGRKIDPEKVIKAADKKLYTAKKGGRNRTAY